MNYEIYWNQHCTMLMVEDLDNSSVARMDEVPAEFIQKLDAAISESRPNIYVSLCRDFGYGPQNAYNRMFNFAACNFSSKDGRPDINEDFCIIPERVSCPIRHRCNAGYCSFDCELSGREVEIVKLFAQGFDEEKMADQLFIARATVHNHITNIYRKLGLSGSAHPDRLLISYAFNNKLVK